MPDYKRGILQIIRVLQPDGTYRLWIDQPFTDLVDQESLAQGSELITQGSALYLACKLNQIIGLRLGLVSNVDSADMPRQSNNRPGSVVAYAVNPLHWDETKHEMVVKLIQEIFESVTMYYTIIEVDKPCTKEEAHRIFGNHIGRNEAPFLTLHKN